jgi:hypothetical protein
MAIMTRAFSADESFFKVHHQKAEKAGMSDSAFYRALISLALDYDLVRGPNDLLPKWVMKEQRDARANR